MGGVRKVRAPGGTHRTAARDRGLEEVGTGTSDIETASRLLAR